MVCQQIFMTKMSDAKWIILVITLLFIITIICQHYAKLVQVKTKKTYCRSKNKNIENNKF